MGNFGQSGAAGTADDCLRSLPALCCWHSARKARDESRGFSEVAEPLASHMTAATALSITRKIRQHHIFQSANLLPRTLISLPR